MALRGLAEEGNEKHSVKAPKRLVQKQIMITLLTHLLWKGVRLDEEEPMPVGLCKVRARLLVHVHRGGNVQEHDVAEQIGKVKSEPVGDSLEESQERCITLRQHSDALGRIPIRLLTPPRSCPTIAHLPSSLPPSSLTASTTSLPISLLEYLWLMASSA